MIRSSVSPSLIFSPFPSISNFLLTIISSSWRRISHCGGYMGTAQERTGHIPVRYFLPLSNHIYLSHVPSIKDPYLNHQILFLRFGFFFFFFQRSNVIADPEPLRSVISDPEFVEYFGEAIPHPKGNRRNVFGHDDQLKVAPKGIAKSHPYVNTHISFFRA